LYKNGSPPVKTTIKELIRKKLVASDDHNIKNYFIEIVSSNNTSYARKKDAIDILEMFASEKEASIIISMFDSKYETKTTDNISLNSEFAYWETYWLSYMYDLYGQTPKTIPQTVEEGVEFLKLDNISAKVFGTYLLIKNGNKEALTGIEWFIDKFRNAELYVQTKRLSEILKNIITLIVETNFHKNHEEKLKERLLWLAKCWHPIISLRALQCLTSYDDLDVSDMASDLLSKTYNLWEPRPYGYKYFRPEQIDFGQYQSYLSSLNFPIDIISKTNISDDTKELLHKLLEDKFTVPSIKAKAACILAKSDKSQEVASVIEELLFNDTVGDSYIITSTEKEKPVNMRVEWDVVIGELAKSLESIKGTDYVKKFLKSRLNGATKFQSAIALSYYNDDSIIPILAEILHSMDYLHTSWGLYLSAINSFSRLKSKEAIDLLIPELVRGEREKIYINSLTQVWDRLVYVIANLSEEVEIEPFSILNSLIKLALSKNYTTTQLVCFMENSVLPLVNALDTSKLLKDVENAIRDCKDTQLLLVYSLCREYIKSPELFSKLCDAKIGFMQTFYRFKKQVEKLTGKELGAPADCYTFHVGSAIRVMPNASLLSIILRLSLDMELVPCFVGDSIKIIPLENYNKM
jgi:hypothetical protein